MKNNLKATIIGSGALGTALAKILFDSGMKNVSIYGVDTNELAELAEGKNTKYFPETVNLPNFETTNNMQEALDGADYVVMAVPSKVMDIVFAEVLKNLTKKALIVNGSKGFFPKTKSSLHEGLLSVSKGNDLVRGVVSLIGPSHAEEMVKEMPTAVASVSDAESEAKEIQGLFYSDYFKTYVQTDVKGSENGATYKNVLAIASGMSKELGYGINTTAALLTRGVAEMRRYNEFMGGKNETIMGLTGIGDLIVTATSDYSRNLTFGRQFVKNPKEAMNSNATVEGLTALEIIHEIAVENKLELPIVEFLYKVIHHKANVKNIVSQLWERESKSE